MQRFIPVKLPSLIGLDIAADALRLVQLRRTTRGFKVENAGIVGLPEGAILEGKIREPDTVVSHLAEWVNATKTRGVSAAIAMPSYCVISKKIELAAGLQDFEREAEIAAQLSVYFPGTSAELSFDYALLDNDRPEVDEFLLIAARTEQVNSYIDVVERAGLKVQIVDIDTHALARGVCYSLCDFLESVAIAEISPRGVLFVVFYKTEILFSQQISGANTLEIVAVFKRALQLCLSARPFLEIEKLFLSGRACALPFFAECIQKECSIEPLWVNPLQKMIFSKRIDKTECNKISSELVVSSGLAIRTARW